MIAQGSARLTWQRPSDRIGRAMPVESETVPIGSPAPDFRLTAIDGEEVSLSGFKGQPVVLVFLRGFG